MNRPRKPLFILLILFTISTGHALDAQLDEVDVTVVLRGDGTAGVFYELTWTVSAGELHGFYFEGMAVEPVFVQENCYALLDGKTTVPLEIKKLAEKYYDVVLTGGRSFSGNGRFYLHYTGDMAAAGSIRKSADTAGIAYYHFDWSPVRWAAPVNVRIVQIVFPMEVKGERIKKEFLQKIDLTIMPETKRENAITYVGTKGDNGKYLLTVQFRQVDISPYQVQHIEFSAPVATINSVGKLNEVGSTAPALSRAENRYSQENPQQFYSPVLFFLLAAAAGISGILIMKKRRSLIEAAARYETAVSLGPSPRSLEEADGRVSIPFPIRLLLYLGIVFFGLVMQLLLSLPGHVPIGFTMVMLAGLVVMMRTGIQNDEKKNAGESTEQWQAIRPEDIIQIRKNIEIEEIKKEPMIIKKTPSRVLFFSLFGVLLFFAAVVTGITGVFLPLFGGANLAFLFYPVFLTGFIDVGKLLELAVKIDHITSLLQYTEEQNSPFPLRPFVTIQEKHDGALVINDVVLRINPEDLPQGVGSVEFKPIVRNGLFGIFPSLYAVCYPEDSAAGGAFFSGEWIHAEASSFLIRQGEEKGARYIEVRFPSEIEERLGPSQRAVLLYTVIEKSLFTLEDV